MTDDLARCDWEIAEASAHTEAPAWLVTLGIEDWKREREWIERERSQRGPVIRDGVGVQLACEADFQQIHMPQALPEFFCD